MFVFFFKGNDPLVVNCWQFVITGFRWSDQSIAPALQVTLRGTLIIELIERLECLQGTMVRRNYGDPRCGSTPLSIDPRWMMTREKTAASESLKASTWETESVGLWGKAIHKGTCSGGICTSFTDNEPVRRVANLLRSAAPNSANQWALRARMAR